MASSSSSTPVKYPYPSEINVAKHVQVKLSPSTHFMWKPMMLALIEGHGLAGFINDTTPAPPEKISVSDGASANGKKEIDNPEYEEWRKTDQLVRSWISSTLNEEDLVPTMRMKTAKELWTIIDKRFNQIFRVISAGDWRQEVVLDVNKYLPLHKAALTGDWESAKEFLKKEPGAVREAITGFSETSLFVAVRTEQRKHFVRKLVELMTPDDLALVDRLGLTALHIAAGIGNIEVVKLLVEKNSDLAHVQDKNGTMPLHIAALSAQRNSVCYLLTVTKEDAEPRPYEGESGLKLVHALILSGFFDIALSVLQRYPTLASEEPSPLFSMCVNRAAFPSGTHFNFLQRLIYKYVPVNLENHVYNLDGGDNKNSADSLITSVPLIKKIRDKKLIHQQALQLVKFLCQEIVKLDIMKAGLTFGVPIKMSVSLGIHEILEEILATLPSSLGLVNEKGQTVLHESIVRRRENVFNLVYQLEAVRHIILETPDMSLNFGLHLAGCLEAQQRIELRNSATNSAMQMQREVQWFKEVERLVLPRDREQLNLEGKTPWMVFMETHKDLVKEGEQWMKDAATSATIVATLVATIVFAAAITVPGGNPSDSGIPYFSKETGFKIFAISDVIALFSSTSSVLIFLAILTSRYAEEDFLYDLPTKLILGLASLFLSIIAMMVAFGATVYLVFGDKKAWTIIPAAALTCFPVTLFVFLQFPLLLDMIKSTYFPGIFRKQNDRSLF